MTVRVPAATAYCCARYREGINCHYTFPLKQSCLLSPGTWGIVISTSRLGNIAGHQLDENLLLQLTFKGWKSDGKDSGMKANGNRKTIIKSRFAGILLCAVREAYRRQERNGRSRPCSGCRLCAGGTWMRVGNFPSINKY